MGQARQASLPFAALHQITQQWRSRWPSVHHPRANSCLTVINVRDLLLDAILPQLPPTDTASGLSAWQVGYSNRPEG